MTYNTPKSRSRVGTIFTSTIFTLLMCSLALNYVIFAGVIKFDATGAGVAQEQQVSSSGYVDAFTLLQKRMDGELEGKR